MKKPTLKIKKGHEIRARRTTKAILRGTRSEQERTANRTKSNSNYYVKITTKNSEYQSLCFRKPFMMPKCLCFDEAPSETIEAINVIREHMKNPPYNTKRNGFRSNLSQIPNYFEFSSIEKVSTSAALVVLAEFQRWLEIRNNPARLVNLRKWNSEVVLKLREIGFFSALEMPKEILPFPDIQNSDLKVLKFITGENGDDLQRIGGQLRELIDFIDPDHSVASNVRRTLTSAISEAVSNVTHHAYTDDFEFVHPPVSYTHLTLPTTPYV